MKYQKTDLFLLLVVLVTFSSGCIDEGTADGTELLKVNSVEEIDAMLVTGPVFVEISASWCPSCRQQKPIIEELAAEYGDRVSFISINTENQRDLAKHFNVMYIPDMSMIVRSENGNFIYLTAYGTLTANRHEANMVGFTKKGVLEVRIQNALKQRGQAV